MAFVGRTDVKDPGAEKQQWKRLAQRRERLYATVEQFRDTRPDERVAEAARRPGPRIAKVMATVMERVESVLAVTKAGATSGDSFVFPVGMALVLEPVVWQDGTGGYRSEEIVVTTEDGWTRITDYPYAPYGN